MKLLLVGSNNKWAIERYYIKYLREINDVEIYHFTAPDIVYDFYAKNIINKILFKLKLITKYKEVNKQLLAISQEFKPDVIWIFKGMEIYPETISKLKNNSRLVNYNPDNPFIFTGAGSGNKNVTKSIGLYDLHFTYSREIERELLSSYPACKVAYLPFGYDLNGYTPEKNVEEILSACFIGNPDKERAKIINQLNDAGISLHIYGHNWSKYVSSKKNTLHSAVVGDAFWRNMQQYRVQLNIMRIHNLNSHNMRTFEIATVGGIQLIPRTIEHKEFYIENEEAFFYDNIEDLANKIKYILKLPQNDISRIRESSKKRALNSGYSYMDRSKFVFEKFDNINK